MSADLAEFMRVHDSIRDAKARVYYMPSVPSTYVEIVINGRVVSQMQVHGSAYRTGTAVDGMHAIMASVAIEMWQQGVGVGVGLIAAHQPVTERTLPDVLVVTAPVEGEPR